MVAAMGEATALPVILRNIKSRMEIDVTGQKLLLEKPRITEKAINRERLRSLPEGTFGRQYAHFLDDLKTSPDNRPQVKFVDNESLLYVMQRYRETHDFTHIVLGMRTNMLGEVTVKYFEGLQLGLPMCVSAAIFGAARLGPKHRAQLLDRNLPWVVEQATKARLFIAFDWENHFDKTISEVQSLCEVTPLGE